MITRHHFTSTSEYIAWIDQHDINYRFSHSGFNRQAEGLAALRDGRADMVSEAEQLINQLGIEIDTPHAQWLPSVSGAYASVPTYLANMPECMYRLQRVARDDSPLRVWVGVTSSAAISREQLLHRGVALTAFAMALSEVRQVSITPYVNLGSGSYSGLISWDCQASPLVLSEICASMADSTVIRDLGIWACSTATATARNAGQCNGGWMPGYDSETQCRELLGCAEDDVWLGSIHRDDPLLCDPIKWLRNAVAKYSEED